MRVTLSFLAFVYLGVAAAGVIPEIAARDDMVAGGNDDQGAVTSGFTGVPNPSDFPPPPSIIPVDAADHPKPTGKHSRFAASRRANAPPPGFPSGSSDHPKPTDKPSRPRPSREARTFNSTAVQSIHPISLRTRPTETDSHHHREHKSSSDYSDQPKPTEKAT